MKGFTTELLRQSVAGQKPENAHIFTQEEKQPGKSKYGNKKTQWEGIWFDSKKECTRYQTLKMLERIGDIQDLQRQVPFVLVEKQPGMRAMKYVADFVYLKNGVRIVEDAKGKKTQTYIDKKKLMKTVHGIEILET